ncbi:MAG TPA: chorismate mutase [Trueperaceae bacterium]|nr:chorismate mutase [Trueperaceae bacterium]HRP47733.1 chorismate mutase [Trueperaceae bacterium]
MDSQNWVRGVRGATTVANDEPGLILDATRELLEEMLEQNDITDFGVISSVFFTTTPDLTSTFPAEGARAIGMTTVPLLCFQEIPVPDRLPRCVRVMMLVHTPKGPEGMRHVYLREAKSLRPDLASAQ